MGKQQPGKSGNQELRRAFRRAAWALRTRFQQSKSPIQRRVIAVQLRALREQIRQLAKA